MTNTFYATGAFDHGCANGGHPVTAAHVVWRTAIGGRQVGVQTCPTCSATRRVIEYAKRKPSRKY